MTAFEGLNQENFDAYTEEKWSSMVHNLTRMKAKEALTKLIDATRDQYQLNYTGLVTGSSDEIPNITNGKSVESQWFYWYRDKSQRDSLNKILDRLELSSATVFQTSPQDKHIVIGAKLSVETLDVGIFIAATASVDRRNLRARLEQDSGKTEATDSCKTSGPELKLCFHGLNIPPSEINDAQWDEVAKHLADESEETLFIGRRFSASEAIGLGPDLIEHVGKALTALQPMYDFFAWSRANDSIDVAKEIAVQQKAQQKKAEKQKTVQYRVGDKVRVTVGLLAGKRGVIESLDGKGKAKVSVGLMSMHVALNDLTAG